MPKWIMAPAGGLAVLLLTAAGAAHAGSTPRHTASRHTASGHTATRHTASRHTAPSQAGSAHGTAAHGAAAHSAAAHSAAAHGAVHAAAPLAGKTVGIDPGHNGDNYKHPGEINRQVWNGREMEACDTTGTATNGGYPEPRFTFHVATYLRDDLRKAGAKVVMTRTTNQGVGPCVNRRATILNNGHSDVAIDIHADGGPAWGRGFSILEPVKDGPNDHVIGSSKRFGRNVRTAMIKHTSMPVSNYYGKDGIVFRNDLAGLNLTTVPKVLIECGNMRNATDAHHLSSKWYQQHIAQALADAITAYLTTG